MIARLDRAADPGPWLRWAATAAWLAAVVGIAATLAAYAARGAPPQLTGIAQGPLGVAAIAVTGLLYASAGAFLIRRRSNDLVGWALLGIGLGMAIVLPLDQVVEATTHAFRSVPTGPLLLVWGLTSVHMPASGATVVAVMLLFPSRTLEWRLSRPTLVLAVAGAALLATSSALRPEGLLWYPTLPNPLGTPMAIAPLMALASLLGVAAFVGSVGLAVAGVAWRFQHGDLGLRRPLAWVAIGAGTLAGAVALFYAGRYTGAVSGRQGEMLSVVAAAGAALLPLAMVRFATVAAARGEATRDQTFLFTDLMESTAMYSRVGDVAAFDLVRLHFETLTAVTRRHGGEIVKTIGDALMARFDDPADAVRAALEMFEELERFNRLKASNLVLKVGVHRGEAIVVSGRHRSDYFGQTVNTASRIGAIAAAGELVVSDAVWRSDSVPPLLAGRERRTEEATLKGIAGHVRVHRLQPHLGDATAEADLGRS